MGVGNKKTIFEAKLVPSSDLETLGLAALFPTSWVHTFLNGLCTPWFNKQPNILQKEPLKYKVSLSPGGRKFSIQFVLNVGGGDHNSRNYHFCVPVSCWVLMETHQTTTDLYSGRGKTSCSQSPAHRPPPAGKSRSKELGTRQLWECVPNLQNGFIFKSLGTQFSGVFPGCC